MNCYDCGTHGSVESAVAACVSCGAGMCASHTRTEQQSLDQYGTVGNPIHFAATRKLLLCVACDRTLRQAPAGLGRMIADIGTPIAASARP